MGRLIPVLFGCAAVLVAGLAHGLRTDRWTTSPDLSEAAARLERVPRTVGDWEGRDRELPPEQLKAGRIAGHLHRVYDDRRKGQTVTVLLVCGRPGPIAVHTPDVCYPSAGYTMSAAPEAFALEAADGYQAGLLTAEFRAPDTAAAAGLRIFWGWSPGGGWQAPQNPRWAFARHPALYKLYVIRGTRLAERRPPKDDPAVEFLKAFLPELDRTLSGTL